MKEDREDRMDRMDRVVNRVIGHFLLFAAGALFGYFWCWKALDSTAPILSIFG